MAKKITTEAIPTFDVISRLASHKTARARKQALQSLANENALVRHEAAFVLSKIGRQTDAPALELSLADPSPFVRHESALALGEIGNDSSLAALRLGLQDGCEEVAQSCEIAIMRLEDRMRAL